MPPRRPFRGFLGLHPIRHQADNLEHYDHRVHRRDLVRAVFYRHQADHVSTDHIEATQALQHAHCLVNA